MTSSGLHVRTARSSAEPPAPTRRPLADPFLLPAHTGLLFLLLMVSVAATTLFSFQYLYLAAGGGREWSAVALRCFHAHPFVPIQGSGGWQASVDQGKRQAICMAAANRHEAMWMGIGLACFLAVTAMAYVLLSHARRRGGRITELPADATELRAELEELGRRAGVSEQVRFTLSALDMRVAAHARRRGGHPEVVLYGGLVTIAVADPARFRAVVLHELAHVRNRDIRLMNLALAMSAAATVTALLPYVGALAARGELDSWQQLWRIGAIASVTYLLLHALLRSRELFADARVTSEPERDALVRTLATATARESSHRLRPRLLRALHPTAAARRDALLDNRPLFQPRLVDGLAAGLVAVVAGPSVLMLVSLATTNSLASYWWAALPAAPLLGAVVAVTLWRQAQHDADAGTTSRTLPFAGGLGLGVATGAEFAPISGYDSPALGSAGSVAYWAMWIAGVALVVAVGITWLSAGARAAFATPRPSYRGIRARWVVTAALTAALALVALHELSYFRLLLYVVRGGSAHDVITLTWPTAWMGTQVALMEPGAVAVVACLLLLATGLRWNRRRDSHRALTRAAVTGLVGGLLSVAFALTVIASTHRLPLVARWSDAFTYDVVMLERAASAAIAVLAAVVAAARSPVCMPRRLLVGVTAAAVVAAVSATWLTLQRPAASCTALFSITPTELPCPSFSDAGFTLRMFRWVLVESIASVAVALPVLLAVLGFARRHGADAVRGFAVRHRRVLTAATAPIVVAALLLSALWRTDVISASVRIPASMSVGANGWVSGDGFRTRLSRGWFRITSVPPEGQPGTLLVLYQPTGTTQALVDTVPDGTFPTTPGRALRLVREALDPQAEPVTVADAPGVWARVAGSAKVLVLVLVAHHWRRILMAGPAEMSDLAEHDLRYMLRHWQWRPVKPEQAAG